MSKGDELIKKIEGHVLTLAEKKENAKIASEHEEGRGKAVYGRMPKKLFTKLKKYLAINDMTMQAWLIHTVKNMPGS